MDNLSKSQLLKHIYMNYKSSMFSVAYNVVKDRHASEDILQDSIVSFERKYEILTKLNEYQLKSYVHRSVKNKAINYRKKNERLSLVEPETLDYIPNDINYSIDMDILNEELVNGVKDHLLSISEQQAEVFMYKYHHEFDNKEISDAMDLTNSNVRVLLHRSRKNIQDYIQKWRNYES